MKFLLYMLKMIAPMLWNPITDAKIDILTNYLVS